MWSETTSAPPRREFELHRLFDSHQSHRLRIDERVVGQDTHVEASAADARDTLANIAEAEQAQRAPGQLLEMQLPPPLELGRDDEGVCLRDAPDRAQHKRNRGFRNGIRIAARNVRHHDAQPVGGREIDVIDARAVLADDFQARTG